MDFQPIDNALQHAVAQGVFPGAVLLVGRQDEVIYERAFGSRSLVPDRNPMLLSTIFDVASLTKPLATTTAVMLLIAKNEIQLEDQVTRFLPRFGAFGKSLTTIRQLLIHSSGLPAWRPFFHEISRGGKNEKINSAAARAAKTYILKKICGEQSQNPPGAQAVYSDLGFMVLGEIIETVTKTGLDDFCEQQIFKPLGLVSTAFIDLTHYGSPRANGACDNIAPTEDCPWRNRVVCGEVHDENAYVIGGIAGHAGLFSSARDIHAIIARLSRCRSGTDSFVPATLVREFLRKDLSVPGSTRALGWDTPSARHSASGAYFSSNSVGHLGFTGTSIWWDPERGYHIVLLSNRVHPTRNNEKIREFRPKIHDLIMQSIQQ
jgi:serine-type D-Ala-D-Ala carboxypeptidase